MANGGERSERCSSELNKLSFIIQECKDCNGTGLSKQAFTVETKLTRIGLKDYEKYEERNARKLQKAQDAWVKAKHENPDSPSFGLCQCRKKAEALREIIIGNIPTKFYQIKYDEIVPREVTVIGLRKIDIAKFIRWYVKKFSEAKTNALGVNIYGKYGRGKSFAMQFLATQLAKLRYKVHYIPLYQLLDLTRYSDTNQNLLREILQVDFLIVDDIGAEQQVKRGSCGEVSYLLRQRIGKKKVTSFIFEEAAKPEDILSIYGAPFAAVCRERNMNVQLTHKIINPNVSSRFVKRFFDGI